MFCFVWSRQVVSVACRKVQLVIPQDCIRGQSGSAISVKHNFIPPDCIRGLSESAVSVKHNFRIIKNCLP